MEEKPELVFLFSVSKCLYKFKHKRDNNILLIRAFINYMKTSLNDIV